MEDAHILEVLFLWWESYKMEWISFCLWVIVYIEDTLRHELAWREVGGVPAQHCNQAHVHHVQVAVVRAMCHVVHKLCDSVGSQVQVCA